MKETQMQTSRPASANLGFCGGGKKAIGRIGL